MVKIVFLLLFLLAPFISWADQKKANLIMYDQLTKPGEKIYLMAQLRKGFLSVKPEISGERVEFFQGMNNSKKSLGVALTGADGIAIKEVPSLKAGIHSFSVRLADTIRYTAHESDGLVACWDRIKPIIIVDIDALSEVDRTKPLFLKKVKEHKPILDADQVLRRLSKNHNIIFFTHSEELRLKETRLWLKEHKFPIAPIFLFKAEEDLMGGLAEQIKEWKKEGWNIKIGIGSTSKAVETYLENGIKAIIIENEEELPDKAIAVKNWKEIERVILRPPSKEKEKR